MFCWGSYLTPTYIFGITNTRTDIASQSMPCHQPMAQGQWLASGYPGRTRLLTMPSHH